MLTTAVAALTRLTHPAPVRVVAESAWGHVAVFAADDLPAAVALGWQPLGTVTAAPAGRAPRHARAA